MRFCPARGHAAAGAQGIPAGEAWQSDGESEGETEDEREEGEEEKADGGEGIRAEPEIKSEPGRAESSRPAALAAAELKLAKLRRDSASAQALVVHVEVVSAKVKWPCPVPGSIDTGAPDASEGPTVTRSLSWRRY